MDERQGGERALQAAALLENPLFAEAFEAVRNSLIDQWERSQEAEAVARDGVWRQIRALKMTKAALRGYIEAAKQKQPPPERI